MVYTYNYQKQMIDKQKWDLYWNIDNGYLCRANLVYSAYVSKDRKHFCMWFNRDTDYHSDIDENSKWTTEMLTNRFENEIKFYTKASKTMPVLEMADIDYQNRSIIFQWPGDDFMMQSYYAGSMDAVLPDWKTQWLSRLEEMWNLNITKLSLHPNSWTVRDGVLVPFNWFFCYDTDTDTDSFSNFSIQISSGRMEGLWKVFETVGINFEDTYPVKKLQEAAFHSFKKNYPEDLMNIALEKIK